MATATVNPTDIPKRMTKHQIEAWVLFGIMVANKEADSTWKKYNALMQLLADAYPSVWYQTQGSPFALVLAAVHDDYLREALEGVRTGQYTRIERAFTEASDLDVNYLTLEALEAVHGIGPKTARMTLLYSQPNAEVVPLDTHVLKYLRSLGYENVPKSTPPAGPKYAHWERIFIEEAKKAGKSIREFDTYVWKMYAKSTRDQRG